MRHIKSLIELQTLAESNSSVKEVLEDSHVGRRGVVMCLADMYDLQVSESLVRSYRDSLTAEAVKKHALPEIDFMRYIRNPVQVMPALENPVIYRIPDQPVTDTIATTVKFDIYQEKPKTIVVMPDVQAPLHDVALVNKFIRFIKDFQPDEIAQVGDFTDSTEISRWVRGKKPEYAGDLQAGFDSAIGILKDIRNVFDGRFRIVRSNHDDRLELYIDGCAPGLASLRALSFENLMEFKDYNVEFVRDEVVELAPGWVMAHGDEGSLSPSAGKTAFGLAKNKFGTSTVCGHTHRAGMTSESTGYNGRIRNTLTGLEVGHFMDLTKADYLKKKGVAANWQQAFGILEVYGTRVYPRLVTVQDGYFSVDGVQY